MSVHERALNYLGLLSPIAGSSKKAVPYIIALSVLLLLYRGRGTKSNNIIRNPDRIARKLTGEKRVADSGTREFEYDVVIVGGGTAGCVLASRLSEDPNLRILVIEAGGSSREVLLSRVPAGFAQLFKSKHDFAISTEPQLNACNVRKFWPRGKMLGGCTAINAMIFHTCASSDYDEWAKTGLDGAEEWSYQSLRKYFLKFEKYNPHPDSPKVDLRERGRDGRVNVGYFGYYTKLMPKFIQACINLGIPYNPDINSPSRGTVGVTKLMTYIDKTGTRVTAESSYLTPEVLSRPNLKVVAHSVVTRILFSETGGKKRAVGVEFAQRKGARSTSYEVKIRKELVLSAGAIHSPHLLLLSGVGPKEQLKKHGISVVHDLPGVGKALQDHGIAGLRLGVKSGEVLHKVREGSTTDTILGLWGLARWSLFGSGKLSANVGESAAFVRSDNRDLFGSDNYEVKDETSGPDAPDLEIMSLPVPVVEQTISPLIPCPTVTLIAVALRPQSYGVVELKSTDPFDLPSVDPKYLEKPNDLAVLVRGYKLLIKIAKAEPLASVIRKVDHPLLDHHLLDGASDETLENQVRKRIETLYHPTSTCRMAKLEDEGVVDAQLKIHGLENVRIVDASIFPRIPSGHTSAPVYAVAEKAADIMKRSLSL